MIEAQRIAKVMGLGDGIRSLQDLATAVSRGLPKKTLRAVVARIVTRRADQTRFIYSVVPAATYKRRKKTLSADESSRTERLARVVATAEYVWDDSADARLFLTSPHPELRSKLPIDVARTELGARQVEDMLWKLFHGVPA